MQFSLEPTLPCPKCKQMAVRWVASDLRTPQGYVTFISHAQCRECDWCGEHPDQIGKKYAERDLNDPSPNKTYDADWFHRLETPSPVEPIMMFDENFEDDE